MQLSLDPSQFDEGQQRAVESLRRLQSEAGQTSQRFQGSGQSVVSFFRTIESPVSQLRHHFETLAVGIQLPQRHMRDLSEQATRTGDAVRRGAEEGALGLRALGVAGLSAFAAYEVLNKSINAVNNAAGKVYGTGLAAGAAGVPIQRFSALSQVLYNLGGAPQEQTQQWLAQYEVLQNQIRMGVPGAAQQQAALSARLMAAGFNDINVFQDTPEQMAEKMAADLRRMGGQGREPNARAYAAGEAADLTPEQTYALWRAGGNLPAQVRRQEQESITSGEQAEAERYLEAQRRLTTAWDNLWRAIMLSGLADSLTKFADWLRGVIEPFAGAPDQQGQPGQDQQQGQPPAVHPAVQSPAEALKSRLWGEFQKEHPDAAAVAQWIGNRPLTGPDFVGVKPFGVGSDAGGTVDTPPEGGEELGGNWLGHLVDRFWSLFGYEPGQPPEPPPPKGDAAQEGMLGDTASIEGFGKRILSVFRGGDTAKAGNDWQQILMVLRGIWEVLSGWMQGQYRPPVDASGAGGWSENLTGQSLIDTLDQSTGDWGGTPAAQRAWGAPIPQIGEIGKPGTPGTGDPRGMSDLIRQTAIKYGVDPGIALRVARSEGLGQYTGDHGTSFGAFQLHVGGGLGDLFKRETGLDPRDPRNEAAEIDWAIRNLRKTGWTPYHGAARIGVQPWEGINRDFQPTPGQAPPARASSSAVGQQTQTDTAISRAVGDSIAQGVSAAGGFQEKTSAIGGDTAAARAAQEDTSQEAAWGRNPSQVLATIRANAEDLRGRAVALSSGASNVDWARLNQTQREQQYDIIRQQLRAAQQAGAQVSLLGVGEGASSYREVNAQLAKIAAEFHVPFTGQLHGTEGGRLHPRDYHETLRQAEEARENAVQPAAVPQDQTAPQVQPPASEPAPPPVTGPATAPPSAIPAAGSVQSDRGVRQPEPRVTPAAPPAPTTPPDWGPLPPIDLPTMPVPHPTAAQPHADAFQHSWGIDPVEVAFDMPDISAWLASIRHENAASSVVHNYGDTRSIDTSVKIGTLAVNAPSGNARDIASTVTSSLSERTRRVDLATTANAGLIT